MSDTYSFVGYGRYPDGTPTFKQNFFTYLDKEGNVILYTRSDITNKAETLSIRVNRVVQNVPLKEIDYVESDGRKSRIVTKRERYEVNEKISDIQKRLPGRNFMRCHRCYIINCTAVEEIVGNCVYMRNGDGVFVSRQNMSMLKNKLRGPSSRAEW